MKHNSI